MSNFQKTSPKIAGQFLGAKNGQGCNEQQPDDQDSIDKSYFKSDQREHSIQRTFKQESERNEQHKSSFRSARSVFESTTITGATLSEKETVTSSTSNSSVMRSFQTGIQNSNVSTLGNPEMNKFLDSPSPSKQPPDKPDRKSKTASHKIESSPSLHSGDKGSTLNADPEDNNSDDSMHLMQVTTKMFDDLHELPRHDSM